MEITARPTTLADAVVPGNGLLRDALLVVAFTGLVAVFAQIAVKLPFTPVPITGQTLAVLLTGGALGARRGTASLGLYLVLGSIGLPIFAPSSAALQGQSVHFIFPWVGTAGAVWTLTSGGYVVGFVLAAYVVGRLAESGWERGWRVSVVLLAGNVLLYLPGLLWLGYVIGSGALDQRLGIELASVIPGASTLEKTLIGGLYPFIVGDLMKLYIAMIALPGAWALVGRKGS